jgi:hypothetical protein
MMDKSVFVIIDKELGLIKTDLDSKTLCIFDSKDKAEAFARKINGDQKHSVEIVERMIEFRKI